MYVHVCLMYSNHACRYGYMQTFIPVIEKQETLNEFSQYSFPTLSEYKIDANDLQSYFGYVEKLQEKKTSLIEKKSKEIDFSGKKY